MQMKAPINGSKSQLVKFEIGFHWWGGYWLAQLVALVLLALSFNMYFLNSDRVTGVVTKRAEVVYGYPFEGRMPGSGGGYRTQKWYVDVEVAYVRNGQTHKTNLVRDNQRCCDFVWVMRRQAADLTIGKSVTVYIATNGVATLGWGNTVKGFFYWSVLPFLLLVIVSWLQGIRNTSMQVKRSS
jgi:hypothetical protein